MLPAQDLQTAMIKKVNEICPLERPFGGITVGDKKVVVGRIQLPQQDSDEAAAEDTIVAAFDRDNKLLGWVKLDVETRKFRGANRELVEDLLKSRERSTPIRAMELAELGRVLKGIPHHLVERPQLEPNPEQLAAMKGQLDGHTFVVTKEWKTNDPSQPIDSKLSDGTDLWAMILPDKDSTDPKFTLLLQHNDGKSNPRGVAIDNLLVKVSGSDGVPTEITRIDGSNELSITAMSIGVTYTVHCTVLPANVPAVPQL